MVILLAKFCEFVYLCFNHAVTAQPNWIKLNIRVVRDLELKPIIYREKSRWSKLV